MIKTPGVSVLLPYDSDCTDLQAAVQSVLEQDYPDFELFLIGCNADAGAVKIARSFRDARIRHIVLRNKSGIFTKDILSAFLQEAEGRYASFFSEYDVMKPFCLRRLAECLENKKDIDICFGNSEFIDLAGNDLYDDWFHGKDGFSLESTALDLAKKFVFEGIIAFPYSSSLFRLNILRRVDYEKYTTLLSHGPLTVSLLLNGSRIAFVNTVVCDYRIGKHRQLMEKEYAFNRDALFEHSYICNSILSGCASIDVLRQLFDKNELLQKASNKEDISFLVSEALFEQMKDPYSWGRIQEWLEDENKRKHLQKRYGFTVEKFQKMYLGLS